MKEVKFVSRAQACALVGRPDWVVISISEPESPPALLQPGWGDILRLTFHDVDGAGAKGYQPFDADHARTIVEFVKRWAASVEGILVHCLFGASRSAAVAKVIAEMESLPFPERYSIYNRHVYRRLHAVLWGEILCGAESSE